MIKELIKAEEARRLLKAHNDFTIARGKQEICRETAERIKTYASEGEECISVNMRQHKDGCDFCMNIEDFKDFIDAGYKVIISSSYREFLICWTDCADDEEEE